jgi:Family of unknown function (DUF6151)
MSSKSDTHPIACRCGAFSGELRQPEHGTRAVCYCRDCQAFARFLGCPSGMMNSLHGTDIVAVRPRFLSVNAGRENLACMSLSKTGTLRWYTSCCTTPIGNTRRNHKVAHVGLIHTCLGANKTTLEESFGPVQMHVNSHSAAGRAPANFPPTFARALVSYILSVAWNRLIGGYKGNPFFNDATGEPIVEPYVVSATQRADLRGDA